jgi:hypothetical protein
VNIYIISLVLVSYPGLYFSSFCFSVNIYIHIFCHSLSLCVCCVSFSNKAKKNLRPKNAHCCSVYVCFSLKYLKRTVIRILMCCLFVCVFLCEQAVPFYKTNSTIEHITPSFRCFLFFFFLAFCFIVHTGLFFFFFFSLSHFIREKLCIFFFLSLLFPFFCCFCFGLMMIMYMVCIL